MTLILALAASLSAMAAPTFAEPVTIVIHYNDLDLATADGRRKLQKRVEAEKRATCKATPLTGSRIAPTDTECEASFHQMVDGPIAAAIAKAQTRAAAAQVKEPATGAAQ